MKLEIIGGRLIDPSQGLDRETDLYVEDGRILALGERPAGFVADRTIQAQGCLVTPGFVDLCAALRSKLNARMATELKAAVKGGITSVCCPPDGSPINDTAAVTSLLREQARDLHLARVFPVGALTQGLQGEQLSEMFGLKAAGCQMVTNMRRPLGNNRILRRCLEYARTQDLTVGFCPEDYSLAVDGCVNEGFTGTRLGLNGIPAVAETLAVAEALLLAEDTGVRAHFFQISTARSVELIAQAQQRGLPVTADVAIHQLLLTDSVLDSFDSSYHLHPPLRTERDRDALRQGVRDGVIQAICSQHQPLELADKQAPFAETVPGMIGLETLLPLTLQLVEEGVLEPQRAIEALTVGPARVMGLELGTLEPGRPADISVIDPECQWVLTEKTLLSACKNTPFLNQSLTGQVRYTLVDGRLVYEAESK